MRSIGTNTQRMPPDTRLTSARLVTASDPIPTKSVIELRNTASIPLDSMPPRISASPSRSDLALHGVTEYKATIAAPTIS